jgi:hypothetical protein
MDSRNRLAVLSVGLGAVGLTCLLIGMVGTYTPSKTVLIQEIRDFRHKAPPKTEWAKKLVYPPPPTEYKVVGNKHVELKPQRKGLKPAKGQQLKLSFAGDTPLGDDDFDAAGYNMEGVWDWKLGKFRSPKFVHEAPIQDYEDPETGEPLTIEDCTPDDSLPKAILYDDCGSWPRYEWRYEYQCWKSWWGGWYGCWQKDYYPLEMPDGGDHELPMGYFSEMGDQCYDDRPLDVVRERTKNEAAWMGGCFLSGCIPANSCSAVELPDGVNIQLFDQPDFKGYTINLQGPLQIPCLVEYGWNDRMASIKVQNSIGMDSAEPLPVDRIHNSDWIYPGGPDSSMSKYDPYFNQWDELDSSPHIWKPLAENMDGDGVDTVTPEAWQADVNNLY